MNRDEKLDLVARYIYPNSKEDLWFDILEENVSPDSEILEIGSGSGRGQQNQLYPKARRIVGLDLDERVVDNPYLDLALKMSAYDITEAETGGQLDCIYSQMVAEHIDDAELFLATQLMVLKPDGVIIHSTVSKYYWVSIINDFVPESTKNWLIKSLGSGRTSDEIFPALYNLNSKLQIDRLSRKLNFRYEIVRQDEPPGYLRRSLALMLIYSIIHKPLQVVFPALRPTFIVVIHKKVGLKHPAENLNREDSPGS